VFVRRLVQSKEPEVEAQLLATFNEEDKCYYHKALATDWVPIDFIARLYESAAPLVHRGRVNGIRELGKDLARDNLKGPYPEAWCWRVRWKLGNFSGR